MTLTKQTDDLLLSLSLNGVLDASSVRAFETEVEDGLTQGITGILLDLHGLDKITDSGLTSLIRIARRAQRRQTRLGLVAPSAAVREMLNQIGIHQHFQIFLSQEAGEAAFATELPASWPDRARQNLTAVCV